MNPKVWTTKQGSSLRNASIFLPPKSSQLNVLCSRNEIQISKKPYNRAYIHLFTIDLFLNGAIDETRTRECQSHNLVC